MAYIKQTWENLPSTNTPISAERLNHMEDGIAEAWEHGGEITIYDEYNESTTDGYSCNYLNNIHNYSTTETKIGKWIDGKDLYQKVIVKSGKITNNTILLPHNISNIGDCRKIISMTTSNTEGKIYQSSYIDGTSWIFVENVDATNIRIRLGSSWVNNLYNIEIILQYTKN